MAQAASLQAWDQDRLVSSHPSSAPPSRLRSVPASRSMSAIFSSRRAWRPPSKGVSSQISTIRSISRSPSRSAERQSTFGVVVAAAHFRGQVVVAGGGPRRRAACWRQCTCPGRSRRPGSRVDLAAAHPARPRCRRCRGSPPASVGEGAYVDPPRGPAAGAAPRSWPGAKPR